MFVKFKTYSDKPVEVVVNTEQVIKARQVTQATVELILSGCKIEIQGNLDEVQKLLNEGNFK